MKVTLFAALLSLMPLISLGAQKAEDSSRQRDSGSVYEAVLSNLPSGVSAGPGTVYAVFHETVPMSSTWLRTEVRAGDAEIDPFLKMFSACSEPPPGYELKWKEVQADLGSRGNAPTPLNRELKIPSGLTLLKADEKPAITGAQSRASILKLGNVFFNRDRTLAVTSIASFCGMLCGHSERRIYEREANGTWREVRTGTTCSIDA